MRALAMGLAMGSRMLPPDLDAALATVVTVVDPLVSTEASIMSGISFRDRIEAARASGTAAPQSARRQGEPPPGAVTVDGFDGVMGAGRGETAGRHPARARHLIGPEEGDEEPGRDGRRARGQCSNSPCHGSSKYFRALDNVFPSSS